MPRILIAGLVHETHCFVDRGTPETAFAFRTGDAILEMRGNGSQMAGLVDTAEALGWDLVPAVFAMADPSGVVADSVFERVWSTLVAHATDAVANGVDAVLLALHGAMVCASFADPEGELLRRLRQLPGLGDVPIFGSFDLHATFTDQMASHADCLICFRHNPHTDAYETSVRVVRLLQNSLADGRRPQMSNRVLPILWAPSGTGTAQAPMADLAALARRIEAETPSILAINVVAGFAYSDVRDAGVSISAAGYDAPAMTAALDSMAALAWNVRSANASLPPPPAVVLDRILPVHDGPVVLVEPSDNIGGGAPGDGTGVLRALLQAGATGAAVAIADPEAVRSLSALATGERTTLAIGGRGSRLDAGPLTLEVTMRSRSDGRFRLEDPHSHLAVTEGMEIDMGPCAVVEAAGVTILLTTRATPPFDLGQWRSQGVVPEEMKLIAVKAAVGHRQAYDPIAKASYTVETAGPCATDLTSLPYRHLRRPVFPLDQEAML